MKTIKIATLIVVVAIMSGCTDSEKGVFAPDNIVALNSNTLLVTNHASSQIVEINTSNNKISKRINLPAPANNMAVIDGKIWVVSGQSKGILYQIDTADLSIVSQIPMGHSPSAIVASKLSGNLWVAQRFNNELWEVDPSSKETVRKVVVGREPVGMVEFNGGLNLLVINNMPEGAATAFPLSAKIDIVDTRTGQVSKRLELPNGSTDVRAVAKHPDGKYAYITHLLGRYQIPTNQVDRGWMMTNMMTIVDLDAQEILTTLMLDTPQKGAANPAGIAITADGKRLGVALAGTHEVAYIDLDMLHDRIARAKAGERVVPSLNSFEGIPNDAGFLYGIREFVPTKGNGTRAITAMGNKFYAANYFTGDIAEINGNPKETATVSYGAPLGATKLGEGEMYFSDAKLCFQDWQSCASCHPNGARVDGLNWDLLNDGPGTLKSTKTLLYTHPTPPAMITGIRKDAYTAVRSGMKHILFAKANENISKAMDKWLISLKALASPYLVDGKLSEAAQRGSVDFDKYCLSCHSGQYYTDMKTYDVPWSVGKDRGVKMDVPALTEVWRTAPYLYDGRSYTIREMLDVHGPSEKLTDNQLSDLAEYVLSL